MSLTDSLDALVEGKGRYQPGPRCRIETLGRDLSPEQYAKLLAAIDNPGIPGSAIAEVLVQNGHDVSVWVIHRHRRRGTGRGCRCPK